MIPDEVIREFHRREFGEELARVNFLPREERWAYVHQLWSRMRERNVKAPHGPERVWDAEPDES